MARRYIKIAKADGTSTVNLLASSLKLQDPYPELRYMQESESYQMRPGPSGPGNLVHKALGTNINHAEISFEMHSLTSTDVTNLIAMYSARPDVVLLSLDSGTTKYYAKFKTNGLTIEGYDNNEDPYTGTAFFWKGSVELSILQTTTTAFTG